MEIENLSNSELENRLLILTSKERQVMLKFLEHLVEFEERRLFLEQGYASLFDYCVRKLKYSDGSAYRRILNGRCLRDNPALKAEFLKGTVNLCTLSIVANSLKEDTSKAKAIIGKSKREVEAIVNKDRPILKPREEIKPIVTKSIPSDPIGSLFTSSLEIKAEIQTGPKEERYELRFSVSKEIYEQFKTVQYRLSNCLGNNLSLVKIFEKLTANYLTSHVLSPAKARKQSSSNENSRYIPRSVKRVIFARDHEQCSFVSPNGVRCCNKHHLQIDHIKPFALGGKSNLENLRLLCSQHNKFLAAKSFGEGYRR